MQRGRSEKPAFLDRLGIGSDGLPGHISHKVCGGSGGRGGGRGGLEKERGIPPGSGPEAQLSSVAARTAARFLADAGSPGQFAR